MTASRAILSTLAITALVFLPGCEAHKEAMEKMERENARLRNELLGQTDQLREARTNHEVEKSSRTRVESELSTTRDKLRAVEKELETTRQEFQSYRRDFHLQSRVRAVGEKHAELATVDGKTYRDVVVRSVLVDTVVFSHADGQARVAVSALGPEWVKRFDLGAGGDGKSVCLIDEATLKQACAAAAKSR